MFFLFKLKKTIKDISRFKEILTVFFNGGFEFVIFKLGLNHCVGLKCCIQCMLKGRHKDSCSRDEIPYLPVKLRLTLEKLGPTFVKLGQILSLRPDFIPLEFAEELKKLQDEVPPFSFSEVKEIIENEFKKPLKEIFSEFEEEPVAAASLGQVHKAVLFNGEKKVAVKILRPKVDEIIEKDLNIMFYLANLAEKRIPEIKNYHPLKVVEEFAEWTKRELDFETEAGNMERFNKNFSGDETVKIPDVSWEWTTKRVLTMEFVEGVKLTDKEGFKKLNLDVKEVAKNAIYAGLKQFYIHGFFHADPHPGNIFALSGNKICFLDFGMVGKLNKKLKRKTVSYFICVVDGNIKKAGEILLELSEKAQDADVIGFIKYYEELVEGYLSNPKKNSMTKTFFKIISSGVKYGVYFPADMVLLGRALATVEGTALSMDIGMDMQEIGKPFLEEIYKDEFNLDKIISSFKENIPEYMDFLEEIPDLSLKLLKKLKDLLGG
jgi:ubiquinone biosynthesis protein